MRLFACALLCALGIMTSATSTEAHGYRHHHHHHHHRGYRLRRIPAAQFERANPTPGGLRVRRGFRSVSFQPQVHSLGCLRPKARAMVAQLTARIGAIQVTSTCGGRHAHNSQHYRGNAVDFRPLATSPGHAVAVLHSMPIVGGVGSYSGGLVHADVGDRIASWHGRGHRRFAGRHHHRFAGRFRSHYAARHSYFRHASYRRARWHRWG